jgi:hypothetical protein
MEMTKVLKPAWEVRVLREKGISQFIAVVVANTPKRAEEFARTRFDIADDAVVIVLPLDD